MRLLLILFLLFGLLQASAQIRPRIKDPRENSLIDKKTDRQPRQDSEARRLFASVEQGMLEGFSADFSSRFAKQVSLTLDGGESSVVSAGQAVSILQNYLSSRKPTQFAFSRWNESVANPYATGRLTFIHRGSKQAVQVYVSLTRQDSRWVISQFNIY